MSDGEHPRRDRRRCQGGSGHGRRLHAVRRRLRRHRHRVAGLRGAEGGRGRADRRDRGRDRRQARGGRQAGDPEGHRPQHQARAQVGRGGRRRPRRASSRRRSSAAPRCSAPPAPPPARSVSCHHRSELADELEDSIAPGHSGILALVSDPGAVEIRKALDKADAIVEAAVDKVVAHDIKAAAEEGREGRVLSASRQSVLDPKRSTNASGPGYASASWPVSTSARDRAASRRRGAPRRSRRRERVLHVQAADDQPVAGGGVHRSPSLGLIGSTMDMGDLRPLRAVPGGRPSTYRLFVLPTPAARADGHRRPGPPAPYTRSGSLRSRCPRASWAAGGSRRARAPRTARAPRGSAADRRSGRPRSRRRPPRLLGRQPRLLERLVEVVVGDERRRPPASSHLACDATSSGTSGCPRCPDEARGQRRRSAPSRPARCRARRRGWSRCSAGRRPRRSARRGRRRP